MIKNIWNCRTVLEFCSYPQGGAAAFQFRQETNQTPNFIQLIPQREQIEAGFLFRDLASVTSR